MISAHGDTREAVRAVKTGAADYLSKPFELDELFHILAATLDRQRMAQEIDFHRQAALGDGALVGDSPRMRELAALLGRVAASSSGRVLIQGESGTGKALVARALHAGSARAKKPFIEINCASLPEQLVEAELFGAERGAYTGAHEKRVGLVSLAHGGTLFLDEIGELPLPLQAKFLHFLENGSYRAIGSGQSRTADVRVIAATNRDLTDEVRAGRFREDLFYRLNVIQLRVPALRDRAGDVALLAAHFAGRYAREEACAAISFSAAALGCLAGYGWPGNVRELKNLVERLTILLPGREITSDDLPAEMGQPRAEPTGVATIIGLPPAVTAMTGLDAMVHAIEAFTSRHKKNPVSDSLATKALELLYANIRTVIADGKNVAARSAMLQGSLLAGMAFANAPVGAVHALAYGTDDFLEVKYMCFGGIA